MKKSILAAGIGAAALAAALAVAVKPGSESPKDWKPFLAEQREQRLKDLREYAKAGLYPHNHGHAEGRIPYFMDRHGRLCAVGYLIAKSRGGADFDYGAFMREKQVAREEKCVACVDMSEELGQDARYQDAIRTRERRRKRLESLLGFFNEIATANNNIRIKDVAGGPILEWILKSGLTQEEAALIQPSYSFLKCDHCQPGSEAKAVMGGARSLEALKTEEEDRVRIKAHLDRVEAKLIEDQAASLELADERLRRHRTLWKPWQ